MKALAIIIAAAFAPLAFLRAVFFLSGAEWVADTGAPIAALAGAFAAYAAGFAIWMRRR